MTIMTQEEAAAYLQYSVEGFYRLLKNKKIPGAFRVGSRWRIRKESLDEYIEKQLKNFHLEKANSSFAGRS